MKLECNSKQHQQGECQATPDEPETISAAAEIDERGLATVRELIAYDTERRM